MRIERYFVASIVQLIDIPLWASVPISTALLCSEPIGVGLSVAAHGMMACHWAVHHRRSFLFRMIVFGPPLMFVGVIESHPVLLVECFVFMCIAIMSSYGSYYHDQNQTNRMRSIIHTCKRASYDAAIAKQDTQLQIIEDALAPAQTVRKFLEYAQRDEDVAILCNSLKRADSAIHSDVDGEEHCVGDAIPVLQKKHRDIRITYTENLHSMHIHTDIGEIVFIMDLIVRALIREWQASSIMISGRMANGKILITVHCGEFVSRSSTHVITRCTEIQILHEFMNATGGTCRIAQQNGGCSVFVVLPTNLH
jgi:hypothetical protein